MRLDADAAVPFRAPASEPDGSDAELEAFVGEIDRRTARGAVVRVTDGFRTLGYYVPGSWRMVTEREAAAWLAGREAGRAGRAA